MDSITVDECKACLRPAYYAFSKFKENLPADVKIIHNDLINSKDINPKTLFEEMMSGCIQRSNKKDIKDVGLVLRNSICDDCEHCLK